MAPTRSSRKTGTDAPPSPNGDPRNPDITPGTILSGYTVNGTARLPDINAVLYRLTHTATGARHIHISTPDKENTFGVTFRTVPEDSTGVAHILEHTVLCGSEQYPVKDPFFSMLKRGLSSFMNALTASDWTMYPFSTSNRKDYYNLMSVYLDAAFFPRLDRLSFKQEGHRLELSETGGGPGLEFKGVVYNEMKGAMSSPSQIMGRALMQALFPDTTYRNNSGGDPREIPALTHEGLKAFHARFYHPSNAFFYTYGSLPLKDHLSFISSHVLDRFSQIDPDSEIPPQPRWDRPREVSVPFPVSADEPVDHKYQVAMAWLTGDILDTYGMLTAAVLEEVLLGNDASPLKQRLIDSGLGSALSDSSGFDMDLRDTLFACGLKDVKKTDVDQVAELVMDSLAAIVNEGVDPELTASAIHQIEFGRKEMTNSPYPFGIKLLLSFAGPWIHGGDPVAFLNIDEDLNRIREEAARPGFLEDRIRTLLLDNPHRVKFVLQPDPEMEARETRQAQETLTDIAARLTPEQKIEISVDAEKLKVLQETEEDLSVLPTLALSDVPPDIEAVRPDPEPPQQKAVQYTRATSDILYFTCPVSARDIPEELLALVPFFCRCFGATGTRDQDYIRIARRIDRYTGGIGLAPFSGTGFEENDPLKVFLSLQGKALNRNISQLFDLISELAGQAAFADPHRLKNLLLQYRAAMEASIVANGHRYAIALASRTLSPAVSLSERWNGISQYRHISALSRRVQDPEKGPGGLSALMANLEQINTCLFTRENLTPAIVGDEAAITAAAPLVGRSMDALPPRPTDADTRLKVTAEGTLPFEGWSTSTSVSFVAQSFKTVRMDHEDAPCLSVIAKLLRSGYLHREIREKGGAYGGFALYSPEEGTFSLASYRDPNIERTLSVFETAGAYITGGGFTDEDVKEAILQTCSEIDKPETPGPAALKAFYRDMLHLTDDSRRAFKSALLSVDRQKVSQVARSWFGPDSPPRGTAVISSREQLEAAGKNLTASGRQLDIHKI